MNRIKIEKVKAARELLEHHNGDEAKQLNSMSIDVNQTVDMEALADIPKYNYYFENVFSLEDFYLYRGVTHFYSGDYDKAISDFQTVTSSKSDASKRQNRNR